MVNRARGLVLNQQGIPVNHPMEKFFNTFESESEIEYYVGQPCVVQEKMDGSLVYAFLWNGIPVVLTRGSFVSTMAADAEVWLRNFGTNWMRPNVTYAFEWISPNNRIVVDYGDRNELVLLNATDSHWGVRFPEHVTEWMGKSASTWTFDTSDPHAFDKLKGIIPKGDEGFVLTYEDGHRVKIKSDEYVSLHRAVSGLTEKLVWEFQQGGVVHELIEVSPEEFHEWIYTHAYNFEHEYKRIVQEVDDFFHDPNPSPDTITRKAMAEKIREHPDTSFQGLLWYAYDGVENSRFRKAVFERFKPRGVTNAVLPS